MVCLQTKNPNLGKFWGVLQKKILVYFMTIWSILRLLEIFYGHLVYFIVIWYISSRFGILYQENSGNHENDAFPPCTLAGFDLTTYVCSDRHRRRQYHSTTLPSDDSQSAVEYVQSFLVVWQTFL
jgi:hypothetical protein